jgi:hypothetical protein
VRETVDIPRSQDEAAAELKRVLSEPPLAVTGARSAAARGAILPTEQVEQAGRRQTGRAIRASLRIHQERERYARRVAELPRRLGVAQSNGRHHRSSLPNHRFMIAQLRDVLAAEYSAIVAEENDHRWPFLPQSAESRLAPVAIRKYDIR